MFIADVFNTREGDDVGAMYADKFFLRQLIHDGFHGHADEEWFLGFEVDFEVVVPAFDVLDVGDEDFDKAVVYAEDELRGLGGVLAAGDGFFEGLLEAGEGERFEEVVNGVDFVAFYGVVAVGSGENDEGWLGDGFVEIESRDGGHVDVEEEEVDGVLAEEGHGFGGAGEGFLQADVVELLTEGVNNG